MKELWEQARIVVDLKEESEESEDNKGKLGCYTLVSLLASYLLIIA